MTMATPNRKLLPAHKFGTSPATPDAPAASLSPSETDELPRSFALLQRARRLFDQHFPADKIHPTWLHGNRTFSIQDYLCFLMLALQQPTVTSLRGLCEASRLPDFKAGFQIPFINATSFSEAQELVPSEHLLPIIHQLSREVRSLDHGPQSTTSIDDAGLADFFLNVFDSTVFAALPKMAWALFGVGRPRNDGKKTASVRFHVNFEPISGCPLDAVVTSAAVDEKQSWANIRTDNDDDECSSQPHPAATQKKRVCIGDRNYGSNYKQLAELTEEGTNFVVRIKETDYFHVDTELDVAEAERAEGIARHAWVRLGADSKREERPAVRLVWLRREEKTILLATNLPQEEASASLVALMYAHRWQVEYFFKWLKRVLQMGHWFAHGEAGVKTQLYTAMILGLLMQLELGGARPPLRVLELLRQYGLGLCSDAVMLAELERRLKVAAKAKASAKKRYLLKKETQRNQPKLT